MAKARSGDLDAFDELVARHQERVFALAYRITGSADDAADVQQETFLRAWRCLSRFEGRAAFTTWLHRIALNLCLARKNRRRCSEQDAFFDEERCVSKSVATCVEGVETRIVVRQLLSSIPPHYRALLIMREVEGRSIEEIAGVTGDSLETVRKQLYRARKLFRERLQSSMEEGGL